MMKTLSQRSDSVFGWQVATIVAIVAALVVNTLSNFFPLNGASIGEISNTIFSPVQVIPANYAFAIWGLIYLGLLALGVYQLQSSQRTNPRLKHLRPLLVLACLAQTVWIFLFLSRWFVGSIVAMLVLLLALIGCYLQLDTGSDAGRASQRERWSVHRPISIYLAWISVATVVNVACGLYSAGWDGWGLSGSVWAVVMLVVSSAIAAVVAVRKRDLAFPAVIVWALVAIAIKQSGTTLIAGTAIGLAIVLAVVALAAQRFRTPA